MDVAKTIEIIFKKRIALFLAIAAFVAAAIPHLFYGFYWDESWVYGPAIHSMYHHGPSLLPNAIPVDLSRGHPLFMPALFAVWMDVFGKSNVSVHLCALVIAVLLAITTYEILTKVFNWKVAAIAVALLLVNVNFFGEATFALNDILLTLLVFLSLYFYSARKYVAAAVFLSLLFLTKESGMVAGVVLGLDIFISFFKKGISKKEVLFKCLALLGPTLTIASFFFLQKKMLGWYLNPYHTSLIQFGLENTVCRLQECFSYLTVDEHIYFNYLTFLALSLLAFRKQKKARYLLIGLSIVIILVSDVFSHKDLIFYAFVLFGVYIVIRFFIKPISRYFSPEQDRFIKLIAGFSAFYIYFCCLNFFEHRYVFPALFLVSVVLLAIFMQWLIVMTGQKLFLITLSVIVVAGVANLTINDNNEKLSYRRMEVQQEMIDYFEHNNFYNKTICCASYLEEYDFKYPGSGFLRSDRSFTHVTGQISPATEYVIFDNMVPVDPAVTDSFEKHKDFFLIKRFERTNAHIDVYQKR